MYDDEKGAHGIWRHFAMLGCLYCQRGRKLGLLIDVLTKEEFGAYQVD
jgi:hypothetical protein